MSCLLLTSEESLQRTFSAEDCLKITNIYRRTDAEEFAKCINGRVCKNCTRINFQFVNNYCKFCIAQANSNRANKTITNHATTIRDMNANVSISALADSQIKEVERLMAITDNAKVREIQRMKAKGFTQSKNMSFWEGLKVALSFGQLLTVRIKNEYPLFMLKLSARV